MDDVFSCNDEQSKTKTIHYSLGFINSILIFYVKENKKYDSSKSMD